MGRRILIFKSFLSKCMQCLTITCSIPIFIIASGHTSSAVLVSLIVYKDGWGFCCQKEANNGHAKNLDHLTINNGLDRTDANQFRVWFGFFNTGTTVSIPLITFTDQLPTEHPWSGTVIHCAPTQRCQPLTFYWLTNSQKWEVMLIIARLTLALFAASYTYILLVWPPCPLCSATLSWGETELIAPLITGSEWQPNPKTGLMVLWPKQSLQSGQMCFQHFQEYKRLEIIRGSFRKSCLPQYSLIRHWLCLLLQP